MIRLSVVACLAVALAALPGWTDESDGFAKFADLGPGVYSVKTDDKGRIVSCIVVGQSRISTVLGKSKGIELARTKARLNAQGEFAKWLGAKTWIRETNSGETVLFLEGSEGNDKDTLAESGKAVEKTTTNIESVAQAQIRGMQNLYADQNGTDKNMTVVLGWDAKAAKAVRGVRAANENAPANKTGKSKEVDANAKVNEAKKAAEDKKIGDKKTISPDAKKFLP
jgi:hypothetical protein